MWLLEMFKALGAMFSFGEKIIPSDKIREDNHDMAKPRLESGEVIKIYDREFRRLKDHVEINIVTDVNFVDDKMPDDQRKELIELLTDRVYEYRKNHPVMFHKFLNTDEFINWNYQQALKHKK